MAAELLPNAGGFVRLNGNWLVLVAFAAGAAAAGERTIESLLPALAYGPACSSTVRLQNLSDAPVTVELEGHRASGALAPLGGVAGRTVRLDAGRQASYQLDIEDETTRAWVKLREHVADSRTPAIALSGTTECRDDNQLRVAAREVAYPTRNPWFSGDVAELHGAVITMINSSDQTARALACYSAGSLYSVPSPGQREAELREICSATLDVQIPPFGTREFPVERNGNSKFSLRTQGGSIVLQMLRPESAHVFSVDSSIQFGEEVQSR